MRFGFVVSLLMHVGVVAATFVAMPEAWRPDVAAPVIVPFELIEIGDETNIVERREEPEPAPPEPEEEPVEAEQIIEEEPAPADDTTEFASKIVEPEAPQIEDTPGVPALPDPEPAAEPEPADEFEPITEDRAASIQPRLKPKPESELDFGRLSALIDRRREAPTERQAPREAPAEAPEAEEDVVADAGPQRITVTEEAALKARMYDCWTLPGLGGGADFQDKVVRIRVTLNRDGSINGAPEVLDQARINASGDSFLQAAARSAATAVRLCAPYDFLPPEKYDSWKEITMRFDPSEMLGG